jgi:hypothetical protein
VIFRTLIIPSAHVQLARDLAAAIDPVASVGLFMTPLTDGNQITHYISTGIVSDAFAQPLPCTTWEWQQSDPEAAGAWVQTLHSPGDPQAIADIAASLDPPFDVSAAEIEVAFNASDITAQEPFVAMGRLGLTIYQEDQNL